MLSKSYKKHIAQGKGILVFCTMVAIGFRLLYYMLSDIKPDYSDAGYLWQTISHLFENKWVSFMLANLLLIIVAILILYINNRFLLIREQTFMPSALVVLAFSASPHFLFLSPEWLSLFFSIYIFILLLDSYDSELGQFAATKIGFSLALGSLFSMYYWMLFPLAWFSLALMRKLSFRTFLASLFGFFIVFVPVFSYFYLSDNLFEFYKPFELLNDLSSWQIPFFNFSLNNWITSGFILFLFVLSASDFYINSFKDKIRIRKYINLVLLTIILASLCFFLCRPVSNISLYTLLFYIPILISHYFALNNNKSTKILFYLSFCVYLIICILPLIN